jgi:hypothetical protein
MKFAAVLAGVLAAAAVSVSAAPGLTVDIYETPSPTPAAVAADPQPLPALTDEPAVRLYNIIRRQWICIPATADGGISDCKLARSAAPVPPSTGPRPRM